MTNRRDVMADAQGSQQLVEEHTGNLVYKLEQLLDQVLDLTDMLADADNKIDELEGDVLELQTQLAAARG